LKSSGENHSRGKLEIPHHSGLWFWPGLHRHMRNFPEDLHLSCWPRTGECKVKSLHEKDLLFRPKVQQRRKKRCSKLVSKCHSKDTMICRSGSQGQRRCYVGTPQWKKQRNCLLVLHRPVLENLPAHAELLQFGPWWAGGVSVPAPLESILTTRRQCIALISLRFSVLSGHLLCYVQTWWFFCQIAI